MTASRLTAVLATLLLLPAALLAATPEEYAARRAALADRLGPDAMLILMSPEPAQRNGDVDWPFRQEDNLLYLTGLTEPQTTLVLVPGETAHREIVFTRDGDPAQELWTGHIPTFDEVRSVSGVEEVVSAKRFPEFVAAAMEGRSWNATAGYRSYRPPGLPSWLAKVRAGAANVWLILESRGYGKAATPELRIVEELRKSYPELRFRDAFPVLTDMRMVKSPAEINEVQRAIDVTVAAQKAAMRQGLTAKHEYELEATVAYAFRSLGACCWAFPSIVASGKNATTLHYETNNDPIAPGELILTDLGAEYAGYSADVTRTYPQNGTFSPEQRAIYQAVLRAQSETILLMKAGAYMHEVHDAATRILGEELLQLGLVTSNEPAQVRWYFPHGLGHHLGLRTHDVNDRTAALAPGMILTNEPGLYIRPDSVKASPVYKALPEADQASIAAALERYQGIGVRIEDDILITSGEPRNLSAGAPRTVEEIESWIAGR
ncbi:MAG: aminopeptidase P family protein [Thermoanaerobaculia bacterium]